MPAKSAFVDTNIIIYAATGNSSKRDIAQALIDQGPFISVQVLNETANVARSKLRLSWQDVERMLAFVRGATTVLPLDELTHQTGIVLARRYNFQIYDALIVASALHAQCDTLYSEDMQHGLVVENRLRITNPFLA